VSPSPRSAKGGRVLERMAVKHTNRYFLCQGKAEGLPHHARCDHLDDPRGQTGFLPTCVGTGPRRPRSCSGEEAQIASGPAGRQGLHPAAG